MCPVSDATSGNKYTYNWQIAEHFNADIVPIAWSGKGMYQNCCDMGETMPAYYKQTLAGQAYINDWDFTRYEKGNTFLSLLFNLFLIYFFSRGGFLDWDYIHECCTARDDIISSMGGVLPSTYGGDESMVAHQCHLGGVHSNMSTVLLSTIGGQHAPINIISGGSNSIYADNCDTYFVM